MINYDTILSSYDDKLTLMQWLKKVEAALKDASAVSFKVNKTGDATLTFSVVFADGTEIESGPITLQQGESVQSAYIQNGHLHLVLTNGDDLDAGNMFNGDITLAGNFAAASVKTPSLTSDAPEISAQKPVVEVMTGYNANFRASDENANIEGVYIGAVKNGNKLTISCFLKITPLGAMPANYTLANFYLPFSIGSKLAPSLVGGYNFLDNRKISCFSSFGSAVDTYAYISKSSNTQINFVLGVSSNLIANTEYSLRYEVTFLLSDSLAA